MLRVSVAQQLQMPLFVRAISHTSTNSVKRYMQTAPLATNEVTYVPYEQNAKPHGSQSGDQLESSSLKDTSGTTTPSWSRLGMPSSRSFKDLLKKKPSTPTKEPVEAQPQQQQAATPSTQQRPTEVKATTQAAAIDTNTQPKKRVRRTLKPRKALISLSPTAIAHLKGLLDQPTPQMIRIGVRNRGCSGLTYNLEYIEKPNKFDEIVEQDGVKVIIDSKALFSIVGSEMDWLDDKLSSRFVFRNPNSKGTCGCGESFMV